MVPRVNEGARRGEREGNLVEAIGVAEDDAEIAGRGNVATRHVLVDCELEGGDVDEAGGGCAREFANVRG